MKFKLGYAINEINTKKVSANDDISKRYIKILDEDLLIDIKC